MFVHYHTEVPIPMSVVERGLDKLRGDLESWAGVAYRHGEDLRAKIGPGEDGFAKAVRLDLGMAEIHRSGLIYPLKWSATGARALFPTMDADLILSHAGKEKTKISFEGTYEPPLGAVGQVVDRILLRRVADSTVKTWVDALARSLVDGKPVSPAEA